MSALYCILCGAKLLNDSLRCSNGCCGKCHGRYCEEPGHRLDIERAREREGARLLAEYQEERRKEKEKNGGEN